MASHQVGECLKLFVEDESSLRHTYLSMDLWKNQHYAFRVDHAKRADCPSCGTDPTYPYLQYEEQTKAAVLCGRNTVQIRQQHLRQSDWDSLEGKLKKRGLVKRNPFLLSCELGAYRFIFFQDGRVLIHGTNDVLAAKKLYYSLIG